MSQRFPEETAKTDFIIEIVEAHIFKNIIGIAKSITTTMWLRINENCVESTFEEIVDKEFKHTHNVKFIKSESFKIHQFGPRPNIDGSIPKQINISFSTKDMYDFVKSIGKKNHIFIYRRLNDDDNPTILIKTISVNKDKEIVELGEIYMGLKPTKIEPIPKFNHDGCQPNSRITTKFFANQCTNMINTGCSSLKIDIYEKGSVFSGIHPNKIFRFSEPSIEIMEKTPKQDWNDPTWNYASKESKDELLKSIMYGDSWSDRNVPELLLSITIPKKNMKTIAKLDVINNVDNVSRKKLEIFCIPGKAASFRSCIGTSGEYVLILRKLDKNLKPLE